LHHVGVCVIITNVIHNLPPEDALAAAIQHFGSVVALARKLEVPSSLPSMWRKRGRVPAEHCPAIEAATGGAVRCEELRPDVQWHVLRASALKSPAPVEEASHAA
jgi:DNA-binding transcriptional regulator YdaS (Cro superfamily)